MAGRGIFDYIWPPLELLWQGGVIFTILMMEGCDFYYGDEFWGEFWVSFSPMFELAGFGQSVIYSLTLYLIRTAYMKFTEYKQASS